MAAPLAIQNSPGNSGAMILARMDRDGVLEHSPAEHVRRPAVPAESPTLGFTHLQFEALLTAARESSHPCDVALVAMLGLLGLRIFEATGAVMRAMLCVPYATAAPAKPG